MVAVMRERPENDDRAAPVDACATITDLAPGFTAGQLFPILDHLQGALACLDREMGLVSRRTVCDNSSVDQSPMEKCKCPT